MRLKLFIIIFLFLRCYTAFAQFEPAANSAGSNAIYKDSSIIVGWDSKCTIKRGYINISDTSKTFTQSGITSNRAFFGNEENPEGYPEDINDAVSLGDGGSAICEFEQTISDGEGYDFAVFENGLKSQFSPFQYFLELAYVEVSSNGIDFVRFPSTSLTPADKQISTYGQLSPENINNLAGKYIVDYGTPFDLNELQDSSKIDIHNINYVKIIDVVGSINSEYANYDSKGNIINDPFPTPFHSCGFDLTAVGVINSKNLITGNNNSFMYPNPVSDILKIQSSGDFNVLIYNIQGKLIYQNIIVSGKNEIDLSNCDAGLYFVKIFSEKVSETYKIIKL